MISQIAQMEAQITQIQKDGYSFYGKETRIVEWHGCTIKKPKNDRRLTIRAAMPYNDKRINKL